MIVRRVSIGARGIIITSITAAAGGPSSSLSLITSVMRLYVAIIVLCGAAVVVSLVVMGDAPTPNAGGSVHVP